MCFRSHQQFLMKLCSSVPGHKHGCLRSGRSYVSSLVLLPGQMSISQKVIWTLHFVRIWANLVAGGIWSGGAIGVQADGQPDSPSGRLLQIWVLCMYGKNWAWEHQLRSPKTPIHMGLPSSCHCIMQPSGILIRNLSKLFDNFQTF